MFVDLMVAQKHFISNQNRMENSVSLMNSDMVPQKAVTVLGLYFIYESFCLCNSARMVGLFDLVISASQSAESKDCLMVRNWS